MKTSGKLIDWYKKEGRDLPWRGTQDPYRILVSEIMLQQTQVPRVKELYYDQWFEQFPDWEALSKATNGEVIKAWAGLGYNRRALMLRDIAKQVVQNGVPKSREDWLELKGIGPYTSAAIAVFSLHEKVLPIDTNIRRVIGRIFLGDPYPQPDRDEEIEQAGQEMFDHKEFYDIPQALFDLATMYCVKVPECGSCPLRKECNASKAFLSGIVQQPKRMNPKSRERQHKNKPYPDRIYRGKILKLVRENQSVFIYQIGEKIDPTYQKKQDEAWVKSMVERLEKDEMIVVDKDAVTFPR